MTIIGVQVEKCQVAITWYSRNVLEGLRGISFVSAKNSLYAGMSRAERYHSIIGAVKSRSETQGVGMAVKTAGVRNVTYTSLMNYVVKGGLPGCVLVRIERFRHGTGMSRFVDHQHLDRLAWVDLIPSGKNRLVLQAWIKAQQNTGASRSGGGPTCNEQSRLRKSRGSECARGLVPAVV